FPAVELSTEVIDIIHTDAHDRVVGGCQLIHPAGNSFVTFGFAAYKQSIVAVLFCGSRFFTIYWQDAFAEFSSAFCHELLNPGSDGRQLPGSNQSKLVTACTGQYSHYGAKTYRWIGLGLYEVSQVSPKGNSTRENPFDIYADQSHGHQPKHGKCTIAPADVGRIDER